MKNIIIILIIFQLVFLVGCNEIEKQSVKTEKNLQEIETNEKMEDRPTKDSSIYKIFDDLYALADKDEVIIRKIDDRSFLIGFQEKFAYQMNQMFYIYNLETESSMPIDFQLDYIDEIRIEEGKIEFYSRGTNIINGFKKFPNISYVNMKTGSINNQSIYSRLGSNYKPFYMGNFLNETKLNDLVVNNNTLRLDFSVSENSILAGGDHCPNISVISEDKNSILIDIENLVINKDLINTMNNDKFVKNISVSSYSDGRNINQVILVFEIDGFNEYTCDFKTGNDGLKDLIISFQ